MSFKTTPKVDHYAVLDFEVGTLIENVTVNEVKKAYRKMALKYHPDKGHEAGSMLFKRVQEAYETLSDDDKKDDYDFWYGGYYKRKTVTFKALDKEAKLRERLIADFLKEKEEGARLEQEAAEKAKKAEKSKKKKEEQRRENERERRERERLQREKLEKERLERERKESERKRKLEEKEKRENEVLERRREEERQRAEERRKKYEFEELQAKIRRATEHLKAQKEQTDSTSSSSQTTASFAASESASASASTSASAETTASEFEQRRKRTESLKQKILRDRARLKAQRNERKAQKEEQQPERKHWSPFEPGEDSTMSQEEYFKKLTELKNQYHSAYNENEDLLEEAKVLETTADRIKTSAQKALDQAMKRYNEKIKLAQHKLNESELKMKESDLLALKFDDLQVAYDSLVDRYQSLYGEPDVPFHGETFDGRKDEQTGGTPKGKSRSQRGSPHNQRSRKSPHFRPQAQSHSSEWHQSSGTPTTNFSFEFKSSPFNFEGMKTSLPKLDPSSFRFKMDSPSGNSKTASTEKDNTHTSSSKVSPESSAKNSPLFTTSFSTSFPFGATSSDKKPTERFDFTKTTSTSSSDTSHAGPAFSARRVAQPTKRKSNALPKGKVSFPTDPAPSSTDPAPSSTSSNAKPSSDQKKTTPAFTFESSFMRTSPTDPNPEDTTPLGQSRFGQAFTSTPPVIPNPEGATPPQRFSFGPTFVDPNQAGLKTHQPGSWTLGGSSKPTSGSVPTFSFGEASSVPRESSSPGVNSPFSSTQGTGTPYSSGSSSGIAGFTFVSGGGSNSAFSFGR